MKQTFTVGTERVEVTISTEQNTYLLITNLIEHLSTIETGGEKFRNDIGTVVAGLQNLKRYF